MPLLSFTDRGIYCSKADVYIDPWRSVKRALITHGHSDHSRWGHQHYLCTDTAMPAIRYRLGNVNLQSIGYGQRMHINGVQFSFHPAGHILGSAQIRVEHKGEIWVVSGDYKLEDDGLAEAYTPIRCHHFITESTFGLPIYKWKAQSETFESINNWWKQNQEEGKVSILSAYSLGKAQRIIQHLDERIGKIYTHGAVENINEVFRKQGIPLKETIKVQEKQNRKDYIGQMVICPPSALGSSWVKKFKSTSLGIASGWMMLRGARRRRAADRGFVLSDHADWDGLNKAVKESGAEHIYVTHGYTEIYSRWLREQGYNASVVSTEYDGELKEMDATNSEKEEV